MVITNQTQALALLFERLHTRVRAQTEGFKGVAPYVADIMKDIGATSSTLYLLKEGLNPRSGLDVLSHSFTLNYVRGKLNVNSSGLDIDLPQKASFVPAAFALDNSLKFLKVGGEGIRSYSTDISDHFGQVFPLPVSLEEQIVIPIYIKDRDYKPNRLGVLTFSGEGLMLDLLRNTDMDEFEKTRHTMLYLSMLSSGISTIISSRTDPLTAVPRRGEFEIKLRTAIELFQQGKVKDISVVLMDIDHFKEVNDTFGHLNGDIVLQQISSIGSTALRTRSLAVSDLDRRTGASDEQLEFQDFFARWGGEEFISIIVSGPDGAKAAAERIRQKIEKTIMPLSEGKNITVTVSFGIVSLKQLLKQGASSLDELMKQVTHASDIALYDAKRSGRNQTKIYEPA